MFIAITDGHKNGYSVNTDHIVYIEPQTLFDAPATRLYLIDGSRKDASQSYDEVLAMLKKSGRLAE